ncbi:MAG: D-alanyl-D-alanine carboxypeptidase [Deltaproteobacteria bacterium]|nr:D-alanyl-D-alanine carboxypeptidase [Deltaproteobacteria bacterium]MBI4796636.1 D-alanyl-D-alanine carboxypeptidase [Deltaproteobacteria bacterium]
MKLSLKRHLWAGTLAFLLLAPTLAARAEEGLDLTARSFVIMDAKTGVILLSYNPQLFLPPASTLKVMTAMYVLEHLKMDDKVQVSARAAAAPPSKIAVKPGEVYTVEELLYALLLNSANDAARALAEAVSGSEEAFARDLTRQVRQWGAYRTTLATANGLPADNQYSTAQDLALLFRKAMAYPELVKIMGTKYHHIQGGRELRNHNRFLFTTPLAVAGKTGFTRASKHTYVGLFRNNDRAIIVSLMGSKQKWADLRPLIAKGFELEGAPIAKLPPLEEKLRFAKNYTGKYATAGSKTKLRRRPKVAMGSAASVPVKKKSKANKKKSRSQED